MKSQYRMLFGFIVLLLAMSLACSGGSSTPTVAPVPTSAPATQSSALNNPPPSNGNSSELVTFTDKNKLMTFQLPGNWTSNSGSKKNYYYDTFTSPAGDAKMENLVYDDGTAFVANQNGKFALGLLHQVYSATGKEGDIKITDDAIQKDGSERLSWQSKSGGYSGVSFFETRGSDNHTFLMFTAWWNNDTDQATLDTINTAISSYKIP